MAEKDSIRPCRTTSPKCPPNRPLRRQNRPGFGHAQKPVKNVPRRPLCPRFHQRSTDHSVANPRPAGVCRPAGWTIALQVKEVGSGASQRQRGEVAGRGAPPRDRRGAGVAIGSLGKVGADLLATLQELNHLASVSSTDGGVDLTTPAGRRWPHYSQFFAEFERRYCGNGARRLGPRATECQKLGRPITAAAKAGEVRTSAVLASARPRSHDGCRSAHLGAPRSGVNDPQEQ